MGWMVSLRYGCAAFVEDAERWRRGDTVKRERLEVRSRKSEVRVETTDDRRQIVERNEYQAAEQGTAE